MFNLHFYPLFLTAAALYLARWGALSGFRCRVPFLNTLNTAKQMAWLAKGDIDLVVVDALGYSDTIRISRTGYSKVPGKV